MAVLPFDKLTAGMVLKKNVCDRSGRLLLPEGVELGEKHLKIFLTWGVSEADIVLDEEGDEPGDDPGFSDIDPAVLEQAELEINRLLAYNDPASPIIRELTKLCVLRKVAHGS